MLTMVPPDPAEPVPLTVKEPFVFVRIIPFAVPLPELTVVSVIPRVVKPAGPTILIAEPLEESTVPDVELIVPSAVVDPIPVELVVKMLTAPRLYVPVPPEIVTA